MEEVSKPSNSHDIERMSQQHFLTPYAHWGVHLQHPFSDKRCTLTVCQITLPISLASYSLRRSMDNFLLSNLLRISNLSPSHCLKGCSHSHIRLSTTLLNVNSRLAITAQLFCKDISNNARTIRAAF